MAQTILETLQSVDIPVTMNSYAGTFIDGVEGSAATVQVQSGGVWYTPAMPFQIADGETLRITRTAPDDAIPTRLIGRPGPNWRSLPDTTWAMPGDVLRIDPDGNLDWENPGSTAGQDGADGVGISSITQESNQITVHLTDGSTQGPFTLPAGPAGAAGAAGATGAAGVSVTGAVINGSGHLILTLSDGSEIDAGVAQGAGGGATALDDLTDVDLTGAADGHVLTREAGTWKSKPATGGSGGSGLPAGGAANKFLGHDGTNPMWQGINLSSQGVLIDQTQGTAYNLGNGLYGEVVQVGANPVSITGFSIKLDGNKTPSGHYGVIVRLDATNKVAEIIRSTNTVPTTAGAITFAAVFGSITLLPNTKYVLGIDAGGNGNNTARLAYALTGGATPTGGGLTFAGFARTTESQVITVGQGVDLSIGGTAWVTMVIVNDAPGVGKNVNGPLDPADLPGGYSAATNGTFLTKTANGPAWASPFPTATATNQTVSWSGTAWVAQHPLTITYPNYARSIAIRSADGAAASQPITNSDKARLIVLQSFETALTYTGRTWIRIYKSASDAANDWARGYGTNPTYRPVLELVLDDGVKYAFPGVSILNSNATVLYATVQVIGATGLTAGSTSDCTLTFQMV